MRIAPCLAPHGAAHADFEGAFDDRHQHDVHHADAADEQGEGGDAGRHDVEGLMRALPLGEELAGHDDVDVVTRGEAGREHPPQHVGGRLDAVGVGNLQPEFVDALVGARLSALPRERRQRHQRRFVEVAPGRVVRAGRLTRGSVQNSDDPVMRRAKPDVPADQLAASIGEP